ncbi:MAG: mechanosensitive ion channel family protein [Microvirga sp.]
MRIIAALLGLFLLAGMPASAQTPEPPAQVRELLKLLGEPAVRSWLDAELKKAPPNGQGAAEASFSRFAAERLALTRARLNRLGAAVSQLPQELRHASAVLGGELQNRSPLDILVLVLGFGLLGAGAEWAFRRATHAARLRAEHAPFDTVAHRLRATAVRFGFGLAAVLVFAAGSIGAFLAFDWPPVLKAIVLAYLIAALAWRVALLVSRLLLEPRLGADDVARYRLVPMPEQTASFWHLRIGAFTAWFAFGVASCDALAALGFSDDVQSLVAFTLGLGLLLITIEALWRRPRLAAASTSQAGHRRREALDWLLTVYLILIWLMWVLGLWGFFGVAVVALVLPLAFSVMNRAASHLLAPPGGDGDAAPARSASLATVYVERGLRAVLILAAALFLARFWEIDVVQFAGRDTLMTRLVRGALSAVVIFLVADLLWQILKTLIDRRLAAAQGAAGLDDEAAAREARLRTLLPTFRNFAFVALAVVAVMMALSAVGIEIGPLIAGAGVIGVAIGFGSQTLVRDVISGVFYLLDDAFRVGEYIQSGNYRGTVESFSLRSVKLRHHRGPVYTVPFGQLGAVQNMSRDWVIDKMTIGVSYDSDIEKAKKLVKEIGKELAADPEFAPHVIEPLKMQGVEQFGDYAIQLRLKMMTKPNEQFVMRRRALAMIKKAFDENGIRFAFPTVQVGGGDAAAAAAAVPVLAAGKASIAAEAKA